MTHYPNPNAVKLFNEERCAYCDLTFMPKHGRCSIVSFPGEVFHSHCVKLVQNDYEAMSHEELPVGQPVKETKESPIERKIFTKGKRKNAKALSM